MDHHMLLTLQIVNPSNMGVMSYLGQGLHSPSAVSLFNQFMSLDILPARMVTRGDQG